MGPSFRPEDLAGSTVYFRSLCPLQVDDIRQMTYHGHMQNGYEKNLTLSLIVHFKTFQFKRQKLLSALWLATCAGGHMLQWQPGSIWWVS